MSAIGGIVIFVIGMVAGMGAAVGVVIMIRRVVTPLRKENRHLENSAWEDRLYYETNRAYRTGYSKGYRKGRESPMNDVERLAATIESRKMDFRTAKEPNDEARERRW